MNRKPNPYDRLFYFNLSLALILLLINSAFEWSSPKNPELIDLTELEVLDGQTTEKKEFTLPKPYPREVQPPAQEEEIELEIKLDASLPQKLQLIPFFTGERLSCLSSSSGAG